MSNNNIVPGFNDEKDDSLRINLEKVPEVENCLTIYLIGYIDTYNSSFFQKRIARVVEAGYVNLIFNCASLNYVSAPKTHMSIADTLSLGTKRSGTKLA